MSGPLSITVDLSHIGLDELEAGCREAARPAAQAGAEVLYQRVRSNVARLGTKTGKLASAIYQAYSKDNSGEGVAEYHVSWNARKAPHGHLVEYGHLQRYRTIVDRRTGKWVTVKSQPLPAPRLVAAQPFVRPAVDAIPAAASAMVDVYFLHLQRKGLL